MLNIQYLPDGKVRYRADIEQYNSQANPEHHAVPVLHYFITFNEPGKIDQDQDQ